MAEQQKPKSNGNDFFEAGHGLPTGESLQLSPEEKKARNRRNLAIAGGVLAFVVLVFTITVLRLSAAIHSGA